MFIPYERYTQYQSYIDILLVTFASDNYINTLSTFTITYQVYARITCLEKLFATVKTRKQLRYFIVSTE